MKISYNLLQTYFEKPLPIAPEVVSIFEKHLAEVENLEEKNNDKVFDVNILPDRACYALSHEAIAEELSFLLSDNVFIKRQYENLENIPELSATVSNKDLCDRQVFVKIEGVDNSIDTPKEIKDYLESLGQRSISFIVDLTNFVMLDVLQPLHAFDADKLDGNMGVRLGNAGEKVITLDGREINLDENMLVLCDEKSALDIAGVKGGKKAEVDKNTKNIILTSSHFDPSSIRQTSQKVGIKTDASKRFENNLSSEFALKGALVFVSLLKKFQPGVSIKEFIDLDFKERFSKKIDVSKSFVNQKLGVEISVEKMKEILEKMHISVSLDGEMLNLTIPEYRKDLNIQEDIVDEIGRIYGLDKIEARVPNFRTEDKIDNIFSLSNLIRNFLTEKGFSEVYTYSLSETGFVEIQNGLASDKSFMRGNLTDGMTDALKKNIYNADLLGLSQVKIFEIGKVFTSEGEYTSLCVGISYKKANKGQSVNEDIKTLRDELFALLSPELQTLCSIDDTGGFINFKGKQIGLINNTEGVLEMNLNVISEAITFDFVELQNKKENVVYKKPSDFPFITRDVAFFVSGEKKDQKEFVDLIKNTVGDLCQRIDLFDLFEKKNKETGETEKTSYGFRIVFQSYEKTLTDEEINPIMENLYNLLKEKGFEIR